MRSKDKVLAFLIEQGEEPISGERIAEQIGISRNAVWKAIEALRNEGCEIEAAPRRGYRLRGSADALTPAGIAARAGDASLAGIIHVYGEIPSTSTLAKEMALHGAPHGTTVIADSQRRGSGRREKTFYSPPGGVYMSVVLRPEAFPHTERETVTACAAVSALEAILAVTGLLPEIKPVNDLFLRGKKICGILTESVSDLESGEPEWIVTGIGINVCFQEDSLPEELRGIAGAIYEGDTCPPVRAALAGEVLKGILMTSPARSREEILAIYREHIGAAFLRTT